MRPSSVFVHPLALVESDEIGESTRIWPFAHVMKGSKVGSNCNICEHAYVEGGAVIGNGVTVKNGVSIWNRVVVEDDVFLGPHMIFTNHMRPRAFLKGGESTWSPTLVRRGATVGAGAVLLPGINIGEYAFVAAGAVVTKSVPAFGFVAGNPAQLKGFFCKCTEVRFEPELNNSSLSCAKCGVSARDISESAQCGS